MQTDTYANLIVKIDSFAGGSLSTTEKTRLKAFINGRAREVFLRSDYWPRRLVVGEFRAVSDEGVIPFDSNSSTLDDVDTFLRIHKVDPWNSKSAQEYEFWVESDGAHLINYSRSETSEIYSGAISNSSTTVPGQLTISVTGGTDFDGEDMFDGSEHVITGLLDNDTAAAPDPDIVNNTVLVCSSTSGGFAYFDLSEDAETLKLYATAGTISTYGVYVTYRAKLTNTYGDGAGETTTIPLEWFDYLAHGAYADWLRSEGQNEKAVVEEGMAEKRLLLELEKIDRQHIGDSVAKRMRTHLNMQQRSPQ